MNYFYRLKKSRFANFVFCIAIILILYCPLFGQGTSPEILRFEGGDLTPIVSDPNVTVSDITFGPGVAHEPCTGFKAMSGVDTGDSLSALIMGDYYEFTVTPDPGYEMTINYMREKSYAANHVFFPNTTLGSMYYKIGSGTWKNSNQASRLYEIPTNFCSGTSIDNHYPNLSVTTSQPISFRHVRWIYGGNPNNDVRTVRVALVWAEGFSALPVELSKFKAEKRNQSVFLNWQTESETENDYFQIEHSTNGRVFNLLGKVPGSGSNLEAKSYQYQHPSPFDGTNYYRLKQVDFDGSFEYSNTISVDMSRDGVKIFPNPVSDYLIVESEEGIDGQILIFNNVGQLVKSMDAIPTDSSFDLSDLEFGIYHVQVQMGGKLIRKKLFKK